RGSSATHGVGVQFTVSEIAGAVRRESSHRRERGCEVPVPAHSIERERVVAIHRSVVRARLTMDRRRKKQRENQDQQSIPLAHLSSTCLLGGWQDQFCCEHTVYD